MTHCPTCQEPLDEGAAFCGSCGSRVPQGTEADATETIRQPSVTPTPQPAPPPSYGGVQPGQSYPGMSYPGQSQPGASYPAQSYPGQPYPGQSYPGQAYPPVGATQAYPQQPPVAYPPAGGPPPQRGRGGLIAALAAAAVVLALAAFFGTRWWQGRQSSDAGGEVVVTVTATAGPNATIAPSQGGSASGTTVAYPDVTTHGGGQCLREGEGPYSAVGTDNASTTCAFAINVRTAYLQAGINGGSGQVTAYSPRKDRTYLMTCSGSQPALCTGGEAARVLIYGGTLR